MSAELKPDPQFEIAHVLFIDIVGSAKLLTNEQSEVLRDLNQIVRNTEQFRAAEAAGKLIRLPTGDGMALAFFTNPEAPVRCAMEISKALRSKPRLALRMGAHSGPVDPVIDVNERSNIAGAGITMAQRVMDCGDAGHILLSKRIADDLAQYSRWQPHLHAAIVNGQLLVRFGTPNLRSNSGGHFSDRAKAIEHLFFNISSLRSRIWKIYGNNRRSFRQPVAFHHAFPEALEKFL